MSLVRSTSAILCVAEKELENERQRHECAQGTQQEPVHATHPQEHHEQQQQHHHQQQQQQHVDSHTKDTPSRATSSPEQPSTIAGQTFLDSRRWVHEQAASESAGGEDDDDDDSDDASSGCGDGNGSQSAAHTGKNSSAGSSGEAELLPFTMQSGKEVRLSVAQLDRPLKDFVRYFRTHFREATKQDEDQVRVFRRRYQLRKSSKKGRDEQRQRQQQLERQVQEATRTRLSVEQVMDVIQPIIKQFLPDMLASDFLLGELMKVLGDGSGQPTH